MSLDQITDELIARQTPEAQVIIRLLLAKIAELEARLNKTPQNSSLPPSTQHPHAKPPRRKPKSERSNAAVSRAMPKHERALIPSEQCDHSRYPSSRRACRRCGRSWPAAIREPAAAPGLGTPRNQAAGDGVSTAPPRRAPIAAASTCGRTAARRAAQPSRSAAGRPDGPADGLLQTEQAARGPVPGTSPESTVFAGLGGQAAKSGDGGSQAGLRRTGRRNCRPNRCLGIDESPTKEARLKSWLWTFVASTYTVFALRTTRAATVLQELLTDAFDGVVNCDRAKMYWNSRQAPVVLGASEAGFSGAHRSSGPPGQTPGTRPDASHAPVVSALGALPRRDDHPRGHVASDAADPPRRSTALLLRGAFSGNAKLVGMCKPLYDHRDWLWTFLDVEGVEPTNNVSERALRPAVIWRKLSFGTQSASGSRFVETILTVVETCHRQSRNSFEYLTAAIAGPLRRSTRPVTARPGCERLRSNLMLGKSHHFDSFRRRHGASGTCKSSIDSVIRMPKL